MPELPEVETMRRGVNSVVGSRIADVRQLPCPRKPIRISPSIGRFRRRVLAAAIERTARVGKRVALWLDTGDAMVFEPRMTGLLLRDDPPDAMYLRLELRLERPARRLLYWDRRGLGNVRLYTADRFADAFGPHRLGPDALAATAEQYRDRLGGSRRAIKTALLDQHAVAGIGNLYASEILHAAAIHPARQCARMTRRQWQALAIAAQQVLREAIRYEGSTLADGTYRNALNQQGGYQNRHRVYAKQGQPCPRCGAPIVRTVQAQRSTFWCKKCQRLGGAALLGEPRDL